MTLNKLHRLLSDLINRGHGRHQVAIDKETFKDTREPDGVCVLPVVSVERTWLPLADDDGGIAQRKDGTERGSFRVVLRGHDYATGPRLSTAATDFALITLEQVELIGQTAATCENLLAARLLPVPDNMHVKGLTQGIKAMKGALDQLYAELAGDDAESEEETT